MKEKPKKFCDLGSHECDRLFHSRTKERPSCCPLHAPRTPIKPKVGDNYKEKDWSYDSNGAKYKKEYKVVSITKTTKAIPKISVKQLSRLKDYKVVRTLYMLNHMTCEAQLLGCSIESTDIHHKKGKIGKLLSDANYFLAVCRNCHNRIERRPEEAKKLGFSLNRLDK